MKNSLILFFGMLLFPFAANAWGATGHRVVGHIAEAHLSKKALKNVRALLGNESLASVSTWLDEIKSDPEINKYNDWHWVTIPDGSSYDATEKNHKGDVIKAINDLKAVLKDPKSSEEEKVFALKALVHFVGDIHQPLHVGNGTDKGGNDVKVKWFKESTNLHRVWDSQMIEYYGMSYTELSQNLQNVATQDQVTIWKGATDPKAWAAESMAYRKDLYEVGDGNLGYRYHYDHWATVELRLSQAGVRLAALLEDIFG